MKGRKVVPVVTMHRLHSYQQLCMMLSCCPGYRNVRQSQLEQKHHPPDSSLGCKGCRRCLVLHSSCDVWLCYEFLNQLQCTGCSFALHRLGCTPPADFGNRFDSVGVSLCVLCLCRGDVIQSLLRTLYAPKGPKIWRMQRPV